MRHAGDAWCDVLDKQRFNAGILSLQPGMPDFVEMIADYRNDTLYKWEGQAEQGLLNWCDSLGSMLAVTPVKRALMSDRTSTRLRSSVVERIRC